MDKTWSQWAAFHYMWKSEWYFLPCWLHCDVTLTPRVRLLTEGIGSNQNITIESYCVLVCFNIMQLPEDFHTINCGWFRNSHWLAASGRWGGNVDFCPREFPSSHQRQTKACRCAVCIFQILCAPLCLQRFVVVQQTSTIVFSMASISDINFARLSFRISKTSLKLACIRINSFLPHLKLLLYCGDIMI